MKKLGVVLALIAGILVSAMSADAGLAMPHEGSSYRMSRRGAAGKIAVRAGRRHFPENAEVSLVRTHAESARRKIKDGLKKRRGVLAMYLRIPFVFFWICNVARQINILLQEFRVGYYTAPSFKNQLLQN